ncbi:hypothetical protein R3P38DRAFT_3116911 [Favolaschia claudopus]|uniref:F-box domain-containing protein n=1 Tax=Favolaschia claudopus TaxID=2862362 RepID=A0AAV9ZF78_9AGAR
MHRCWKVAELTQMIFEELVEEPSVNPRHPDSAVAQIRVDEKGGPVNAKSVLQLATTCKNFSTVALDILWRRSNGVIKLLKCLPPSTWCICEDGYFRIVAPLAAEDWNLVLNYSRRIRTFSDHEEDIYVDASVLESIIHIPCGVLLPNVRKLSCHSASSLFPYIDLLLGSRLRNLTILFDGPSFRIPFIRSLQPYFPQMEHAYLQCDSAQDQDSASLVAETVSSVVTEMPALRTLCVDSLDAPACNYIANLSSLKDLTVWHLASSPSPHPLSNPVFIALRKLVLTAMELECITDFVTTTVASPLRSLWIDAHQPPNAGPLLCALYSACNPRHLTSIQVDLYGNDTVFADLNAYIIPVDFLQPLLVFSNLRRVRLMCTLGVILDDKFLDAMARAWPQIEELWLQAIFCYRYSPDSYPTVNSLHSLAQHCLSLRELRLAVDITTLKVPEITHRTLEFWHPLDSPIHSPRRAADLLTSCFPSVSIVPFTLPTFQPKSDEMIRRTRLWGKTRKLMSKPET